MSTKSQLRRRVVRLALIVALTAPAGLALADNGPDEIPRDTSASVPELPAYPFAMGVQSSNKGNAQSSRQAIARIFGFSRQNGNGSTKTNAPQALPSMSSAPMQLPSITQSLPAVDVRSAQAMIGHPQMPEVRSVATTPNAPAPNKLPQLSTKHKALESARGQADNPMVVTGSAKKMGPIEHSLSDKDQSSEVPNSADMVNDLVNSLVPSEPSYEDPADSAPQFSDSVNIQVAEKSEESSVNMSLSDRDEPIEEKLASSQVEKEDAPQMMSFSDKEASPAIGEVASTSKPTYEQVVSRQEEPAAKATTSSFEYTVQHAVSSRRDLTSVAAPKNEVRAPELQSSARQPLVPMLASASGRSRINSEPRALQPVPNNSAVTTAHVPAASQVPMEQPALSVPPLKQQTTAQSTPTQATPTQPSTTQQVQGKEIRVAAKDSVSLQSVENIQAVSVEQEDICQIIQNGPKSYSVIGLRDGETRIAIMSESNGQRNVQLQKVVVSSSKNSTIKDNATLAAEISQTVAQLYPRQRVRISPRGSQLVISGTVDSEDIAKKIVSLVRKTTLTPVVDELKTK